MKLPTNLAVNYEVSDFEEDVADVLTCLLVEDERFDRINFKRLMARSKLKLDIVEANNSAEAREILNARDIDIVFLDNNLPDGLGLFLARELKNIQKFNDLPIVMISGQDDDQVVSAAKDAGCFALINKLDFSTETLSDIVQQALDYKRASTTGSPLSEEDVALAVQRFAKNCTAELNVPILKLLRVTQKLNSEMAATGSQSAQALAKEITAIGTRLQAQLTSLAADNTRRKTRH